MVKLKALLSRFLKRSHPDIYEALKEYCEKKGLEIGDVVAASVSAYLSADEEGKDELERVMEEKRTKMKSTGIKEAVGVLKELVDVYKDLSEAFASMRTSFHVSQIIADYKALSDAAKQISELGQSKGAGSLEDVFARAFIDRMLSGFGKSMPLQSTKTGKGKVEKIDEEES